MRYRVTLVGTNRAVRLGGLALVNLTLAVTLVLIYIAVAGLVTVLAGSDVTIATHIAATVAVAVCLVPLRSRLLSLSHWLLRRRWQTAQDLVRDLGDTLARAIETETLARTLVDELPGRLGLQTAALWILRPPDEHTFVGLAGSDGRAPAPFMAKGVTANHIAQIAVFPGYTTTTPHDWSRPFTDAGLTIIIPLRAGEQLIGVYGCAGRPDKPMPVFVRDLLLTLTPAIAASVGNARAYATIAALNAQLQQLDHLKSAFIESVGHELRTPLTTLSLSLSLLGHQPGVATTLIEMMQISTTRLAHLVEQILTFEDHAYIAASAKPGSTQLTPLAPLLKLVAADLGLAAQTRDLHVAVAADESVAAWIVAERLVRILRELLDNAIRYAVPGTITIAATFVDGLALISVRDQGPGIAPEERDRLFDPFYRGRGTRAQAETPGAGLGLSIARREVEQLDGRIWIERSDRNGTEIRIAVPGIRIGTGELRARAIGA